MQTKQQPIYPAISEKETPKRPEVKGKFLYVGD